MDDCRKCQTSTATPAEPGGPPLVRIGERDLLVFALHHLRVDRVEPNDLLLELLDLAL